MPEVITTALAETDRGAVSDEAVDHFLSSLKSRPWLRLVQVSHRTMSAREALFARLSSDAPGHA